MSPAEVVVVALGLIWIIYLWIVLRRAWLERGKPNQQPFPDTVCPYEERLRKRFRAQDSDRGMGP